MATARWSWHAAAGGNGPWVASTHPKRLFSRGHGISAVVLASLLASGRGDDPHVTSLCQELGAVTDRLIISYQHAYERVTSHGETGFTARLLPFTVDGPDLGASMFSGRADLPDLRQVFEHVRALGLIRTGQPARGLSDDFALLQVAWSCQSFLKG